jgi:hypothetical protein
MGQRHPRGLVERVGAVLGRALAAYGRHHLERGVGVVLTDAYGAQLRRSAGSAVAVSGAASFGSLVGRTKR